MRAFQADDLTEQAKRVAAEYPTGRQGEGGALPARPGGRKPDTCSLDPSYRGRDAKIAVRALDRLGFGATDIELRGLEQLVDASQTRAIGAALVLLSQEHRRDGLALADWLDDLDEKWDTQGLDQVTWFGQAGEHPGNLARPRRFEVAAALNRLRTLRVDAPAG